MDNSKEGNGKSPPPIDLEPSSTYDTLVLEYISEMLMEEEEEFCNNPFMLHDSLALQATEKSLHDALHNINLDTTCRNSLESNYDSLHHSCPSSSGVKKNHRSWEDSCDMSEHHRRSQKKMANNNTFDDDEYQLLEMHDDVLLCPKSDSKVQTCGQTANKKSSHRNEKSKRGPERKSGEGGGKKNNIVDLSSLLVHCAEAMAKVDNKTVNELLREIRQHSSPKGDGTERLAHYFADALQARLACTGTYLYAALDSKRISAAEILEAYKVFVLACPFKRMSNILANATILNLATEATTLHIIDFGILYGCQWPCIIHALSKRPGGPPKLRITGIDFPQPGFRPAVRVADTGRRLAKYSERFGVPFEYNAIAQKWDTIALEDVVKIEKNHELVVVNCLYRLHNVPDETETGESPRDVVLNLIKKINPDLFLHGVANGKHNSPFFVTRFKEALFHFSSMFDMFEATIPADDEDRLVFEQQFLGKEAMNIIACDGTERVERPETYKQWQARTARAGFRQVPLDQQILKRVDEVKTGYHKNFSVEEDGKWILLGWRGRVVQGFSCWRPAHIRSSS